MNELKRLFKNGFPKNECVVQDEKQPEVLNGKKYHWCLLKDKRFSDIYTVIRLCPYTYREGNYLFFGWFDKSGNLYDDVKFPNGGYDCVVGYKE